MKNFLSLFTKNSGILKTISEKTIDTKTPQVSLQQRTFGSFSEGVQGGQPKPKFVSPLPMIPIAEENSSLKVPIKGAMKRVSVYTNNPNLADKFQEFMNEELHNVKTKGGKIFF